MFAVRFARRSRSTVVQGSVRGRDFLGEIQCAARAKPHKSKLKGIGDVMFGKILAIMRVMIDRPWEQYCIPIDTP